MEKTFVKILLVSMLMLYSLLLGVFFQYTNFIKHPAYWAMFGYFFGMATYAIIEG